MGFDAGYGIGSVKPGVCTSSTRPASPFTGQMIFETDTNRVAVYNGSSWVVLADADTPSGLELVKTQTIGSAVSSVTVNNAFSSNYDSYKIVATGGAASTSIDLWMTLGATASGYYTSLFYTIYNNTAAAVGSSNQAKWTYAGAASTTSIQLSLDIHGPYLSEQTSFSAMIASDGYAGHASGYLANSTSYTDFTVTCSTGTLTGGTIRVYGYRNS